MSLFSSVKAGLKKGLDRSASTLARQFLQERVAPYGDLVELDLDSRAKTLRAVVHLKGEASALDVVVERYEVVGEGGQRSLVVRSVRTSRPWVTQLLNDFLVGRPFPLPEKYSGMIEKLL